jgi:guanosine-3',5'-bis(diphosphate) 3'-pyrophosphohydrolase
MNTQSLYQTALKYAATRHEEKQQRIPGSDLPYVVHLSNVAMETIIASYNTKDFDINFAVQVALLHDTVEDTSATYEELEKEFGTDIADGVQALTKNKDLPKSEQMTDSIQRIKKLKKEVWAIKLADRITNMQKPPQHWSNEKCHKYHSQAQMIHDELKDANDFLAKRLQGEINTYTDYLE